MERYSRHIVLPEIDVAGQKRLLDSSALIVGLGGLGSPVAMYLASSGVGHLIINDHDHVDLGNLQRQLLHATPDLDRPKVDSARDALQALNPDISITAIRRRLSDTELEQQARDVDVVIDASDNFTTRYALNAACVAAHVPLVWGAAIRLEGQVTTFCNNREEAPCLNCLYPYLPHHDASGSCGDNGIFAPVTGIIGSIMATEALKVLLTLGNTLCGRLLRLDSAALEWRQSQLMKDPSCAICGAYGQSSGRPSHRGKR